jgi:hypothetical protein
VRATAVLAFVLIACGPSDRREDTGPDAPSASTSTGPDQIILRIPRSGGAVRAYRYPKLDSLIWTSATNASPPGRVLAFDADAGSIAYVDRNGVPGRIDLRSGNVGVASRAKLTSLSSADGYSIYGIAANGSVTRITPTGDWTYAPNQRARLVLPQRDGTLLVLIDEGANIGVLRLRPPDNDVTDSAEVPDAKRIVHAQAGDRVYFGIDSSIFSLRGRALDMTPTVSLAGGVLAVVPTPSGDRLFAATDSSNDLVVIDRYRDQVDRTIQLPGRVSALRMDPLGRYVLARAAVGDSAWVVALGTARVVGSVVTSWRDDLPLVAPDGAVLLAAGKNVRIVEGETLKDRAVVNDGAEDFWHVIVWNGFRPRSGELDQPVTFENSDSAAAVDSTEPVVTPAPRPDSAAQSGPPRAPIPRPTPPRIPVDTGAAESPRTRGWTVSFAAYLSESSARSRAAAIVVDGQKARVVSGQTPGTNTTVYRVVLGPYPTKADAERVGRESKESFWVYEGNP